MKNSLYFSRENAVDLMSFYRNRLAAYRAEIAFHRRALRRGLITYVLSQTHEQALLESVREALFARKELHRLRKFFHEHTMSDIVLISLKRP